MTDRVAKRVRYFGRVQGVGFRKRTNALALELPVTGYVMNLPDGSVELRVEGEGDQVSLLLERIAEKMRAEITSRTVDAVEFEPFADFKIRR